jgi:hypothetical protein
MEREFLRSRQWFRWPRNSVFLSARVTRLSKPTNEPTPWTRVLLEKLTITQPVKNFTVFYGTRRFITVFSRFVCGRVYFDLFRF